MIKVGIIDYKAGNTRSLFNTLTKIGCSDIRISNKKKEIKECTHIILPGVGNYQYAITQMKKNGLVEYLKSIDFQNDSKKLLGICLGMQLLFESSLEDGYMEGIGLFKGTVQPLKNDKLNPLPNIGWREVMWKEQKKVEDYYFAHSYRVHSDSSNIIVATSKFIHEFPAIVKMGNILGTQFHPEISGEQGKKFLKDFIFHE